MLINSIARNGDLYFGLVIGQTYYLYAIQGPRYQPSNNTHIIVNAATTISSGKYIGMQKTGMPLAMVVFAMLLVIGGCFSAIKKQ